MTAILFSKLGIYPLYKFDEPRCNILEHLNDFEIIGYGGHFFYKG